MSGRLAALHARGKKTFLAPAWGHSRAKRPFLVLAWAPSRTKKLFLVLAATPARAKNGLGGVAAVAARGWKEGRVIKNPPQQHVATREGVLLNTTILL